MTTQIHPTAIVEDGVKLGTGTSVWDNVHIRHGARLGNHCIVGDKTHIGYDVRIGNLVKIGAFCNISPGVTIENGVMISNGTIFTNHKFPRATTPDLQQLRPSEPGNETLLTLVREGATLGAGVTVLGGVVIGRFAMIGLGAVVTSSVPDFHLAIGHPAKSAGCVCRCGFSLIASARGRIPDAEDVPCAACGLKYTIADGKVVELTPPV